MKTNVLIVAVLACGLAMKSLVVVFGTMVAGVAVAGISVDESTGWSVVDREGYTFGTATTTPYPGLVFHGDVAVNAKTLLADCGSSTHNHTLSLAPDPGDDVTVTVKAQFGNSTAGQRGLFLVGENGGWGSFDFQAGSLQFYELRVCEKATVPDADEYGNAPVVVTLGKNGSGATANIHFIKNCSPKPVRILFDGGSFSHTDGSGGSWLYTTGGDIVLEGKPGCAIRFNSGGHSLDALGQGPHKLTVKGDCDFFWDGSNDAGNGGTLNIQQTTSCACEMLYTGKTVISGPNSTKGTPAAALYFSGIDNWFPVGEDKGELEIRSIFPKSPTWINLMGTTQTVNSVIGKGVYSSTAYPGIDWGVVSNRSSTAAHLVVGKYADGVLRNVSLRGREHADNLVTVQQGHRVCVANADVERYDLESGELVVGAKVAFGKLMLAEGATLTADGVIFDVSASFVEDHGASFSATNGGVVVRSGNGVVEVLASAGDEDGAAIAVPAGSVLIKSTVGELYVKGGVSAFAGHLHVAVGTLGFANDCSRHEWWRLVFKKRADPAETLGMPGLGGVMLSDVADRQLRAEDMAHNLTYGTVSKYGYLGTRPDGVDAKYVFYPTAADMPNGSVAVNVLPADVKWTDGSQKVSPDNAFNTLFQNQNPAVQNSLDNNSLAFRTLTPEPGNPASWPVITWRNKAGLAGVKGYSFKQSWSGLATGPSDWSLEASANGVDWFEVDVREGERHANVWWSDKGMDDYDLFLACTLCDRDANASLSKLDSFALKDMMLPATKPEEGSDDYATVKQWIEGTSATDERCYLYFLARSWPSWYNGGDRRNIVPYPIRAAKDCGVFGLASGVSVQVDKDATLKLGNAVDAGRTLSHLVVDWVLGGGTVDGMLAAQTGVLELVNVPADADLANTFVPLALSDAENLENVRNWTLKVNGKMVSTLKLKVVGGRIKLSPFGTLLLIR